MNQAIYHLKHNEQHRLRNIYFVLHEHRLKDKQKKKENNYILFGRLLIQPKMKEVFIKKDNNSLIHF